MKKFFSILKSKSKDKIDKVILGIGNPGEKYSCTRHNLGFDVVDAVAQDLSLSFELEKCKSLLAMGEYNNQKILLVKPLTFVNLSGQAAKEIIHFGCLDSSSLLVVVDDIHLKVGDMRFRPKGSSGGHNGLKSIISYLGTEEFPRLRIGIGQPQGELIEHVLSCFSQDETSVIKNTVVLAKEKCKNWLMSKNH